MVGMWKIQESTENHKQDPSCRSTGRIASHAQTGIRRRLLSTAWNCSAAKTISKETTIMKKRSIVEYRGWTAFRTTSRSLLRRQKKSNSHQT
ncbi:hypothetical protein NQ315_013276 [Exocentrus adspersus]|uniref:Uncharacterized protein n=1 Tax=Exocentrus adspersus TaxID=1586481 RepID=A0AAV8VKK1_9CUCU|nr:hypothetical protein NQ315_013276 [Exocentrus adspersus]